MYAMFSMGYGHGTLHLCSMLYNVKVDYLNTLHGLTVQQNAIYGEVGHSNDEYRYTRPPKLAPQRQPSPQPRTSPREGP